MLVSDIYLQFHEVEMFMKKPQAFFMKNHGFRSLKYLEWILMEKSEDLKLIVFKPYIRKFFKIFKISNIYCNIKFLRKKMCKNKNMINYTFLKSPYHGQFKSAKIFENFSKTKFLIK